MPSTHFVAILHNLLDVLLGLRCHLNRRFATWKYTVPNFVVVANLFAVFGGDCSKVATLVIIVRIDLRQVEPVGTIRRVTAFCESFATEFCRQSTQNDGLVFDIEVVKIQPSARRNRTPFSSTSMMDSYVTSSGRSTLF